MNSKHKPVLAILGGGNGAFAHAADLGVKGFQINLCEVPEMGHALEGAKNKGGIHLKVTGNPGLLPGFAKISKVTTDAREALEDANIVMIVVPAFAQRRFAEFCAPYLRSDHLVLLSPGNFGGCLEFGKVLRENHSSAEPLLCETECMTYSGFKTSPVEVEVSGYKRGHTMAAFPGKRTAEALERLSIVFPEIKAARNIMETGLRNVNTVMHAPIMVLNAGRVEDTEGKFLFYWQGVTEGVGRVVEKIEAERLEIGKKLGIDLTPTRDVLLEYYQHSGAAGNSLPEVMRTNPVYSIDWAPSKLRHRFLTEDIPYGMVPMEQLGKMTRVVTPNTTAIIELASSLLGEDFRSKARDLKALGLEGLSVDQMKSFFDEGSV